MTTDNLEIVPGPTLETKFAPDDGAITGYLVRYREIDGHGDVFAAGAFTKSLAEIKASGLRVPLLWQHDQGQAIGSWHDLEETPEGVVGRAVINDGTARGREALALVRKGDLSGLSPGFISVRRNGNLVVEAALKEGSLVSIPSANRARVTLKDFRDLTEYADFLKDSGMSRRDAEFIARKSWPTISEQPPEIDPAAIERLGSRVSTATLEIKSLKGIRYGS